LPGTPVYKIREFHTIFYLCVLVLLVYLSVFTFVSLIKNTKKSVTLLATVTMGSTEITKTREYTSSSIAPITSVGIYKSNKPCDYTSYNGELCPWHGLPGKELDLWLEKTPKPPQTWEEV